MYSKRGIVAILCVLCCAISCGDDPLSPEEAKDEIIGGWHLDKVESDGRKVEGDALGVLSTFELHFSRSGVVGMVFLDDPAEATWEIVNHRLTMTDDEDQVVWGFSIKNDEMTLSLLRDQLAFWMGLPSSLLSSLGIGSELDFYFKRIY